MVRIAHRSKKNNKRRKGEITVKYLASSEMLKYFSVTVVYIMSLDKSIKHGKEHRKPYSKAKAVDKSCRNHGDCLYCQGNRLYQARKELDRAEDKLKAVQVELVEEECGIPEHMQD